MTDDLLGSVAGEELEAYLTQLQERFVSAGESAGAARGKEGEEGRRHERTQVHTTCEYAHHMRVFTPHASLRRLFPLSVAGVVRGPDGVRDQGRKGGAQRSR